LHFTLRFCPSSCFLPMDNINGGLIKTHLGIDLRNVLEVEFPCIEIKQVLPAPEPPPMPLDVCGFSVKVGLQRTCHWTGASNFWHKCNKGYHVYMPELPDFWNSPLAASCPSFHV